MLHQLLSALIEDLLGFLGSHKDFFGLEQNRRKVLVEQRWGEGSMSSYLMRVNDQQFVEDLTAAMKILKGQSIKGEKGLLETLAHYFLEQFPKSFDHLNGKYFHLSDQEQRAYLLKIFPGTTPFFQTLRSVLLVQSTQDIGELLVSFLRDLYQSPRIIIQSPLECDQATKQEIRKLFLERYPKSFLVFTINTQLIGGIRFFVDGKVEDLSWFSKIQALQSLSSQR